MTGMLALVTIGQSPRIDVLPDLLPVLEDDSGPSTALSTTRPPRTSRA